MLTKYTRDLQAFALNGIKPRSCDSGQISRVKFAVNNNYCIFFSLITPPSNCNAPFSLKIYWSCHPDITWADVKNKKSVSMTLKCPPHVVVFQGRDSLPQLLQVADGLLLPAVLEFVIGGFPHERQVCSGARLHEQKHQAINK